MSGRYEPCNMGSLNYEFLNIRILGQVIDSVASWSDDTCDRVNGLLNQLYASTPNVVAILDIVNCVLKIVEALKGIPEAVSTLDVGGMIDLIADVSTCVNTNIIAKLLPQTTIPKTIYDLLRVVIFSLDCIISVLTRVFNFNIMAAIRVDQANDVGSRALKKIGICAESDAGFMNEGLLSEQLASYQAVMGLMNLLVEMLMSAMGGKANVAAMLGYTEEEFPFPIALDVSTLMGDSADDFRKVLQDMQDFQRDVLIPLYETLSQIAWIVG